MDIGRLCRSSVDCLRVGLVVMLGRAVVDVGLAVRERGLVGRDGVCLVLVFVVGLFGEDAVMLASCELSIYG